MSASSFILRLDDPELDVLLSELSSRADALDASGAWPSEQWSLLRDCGAPRWFFPESLGGLGWSETELASGYIRLASACLATTFVLTQPAGAGRRLAEIDNSELRSLTLPSIVSGEKFASVGIAHLTTSRRHLARPMVAARETARGFVLEGVIPWVTGGEQAEWIVTGATLADGRQIVVALPTSLPGVVIPPAATMVGLTATRTGEVHLHEVELERVWLMAGPTANVLSQGGVGARTGGIQTSALALGLAQAALDFLLREATNRSDLPPVAMKMRDDLDRLRAELLAAATSSESPANAIPLEPLRARANSLVLRATQAALTAAKGSGYVSGHPAGRWCREALFFLVWSCPQPVANAALCELSGLATLAGPT